MYMYTYLIDSEFQYALYSVLDIVFMFHTTTIPTVLFNSIVKNELPFFEKHMVVLKESINMFKYYFKYPHPS